MKTTDRPSYDFVVVFVDIADHIVVFRGAVGFGAVVNAFFDRTMIGSLQSNRLYRMTMRDDDDDGVGTQEAFEIATAGDHDVDNPAYLLVDSAVRQTEAAVDRHHHHDSAMDNVAL